MKQRLLTFILYFMTSLLAHAQSVTDWHCHIIPDVYRQYLTTHNALMDEGFPLPQWTTEEHLRYMDEQGIQTSVLSLAAPQPYFGTAQENAHIVRLINEEAAALAKQYPDRFRFCAALPLPDVEASIREAIYALDTLHADGIKLATNSNGQYLGTPELDPLFAVLNERKAVIILHPHRPQPVSEAVMQQTPLAMQEYLSETTRAVCNMLTSNIPARYPDLRFVIPHCGAYLPLALQRMQALAPVMQSAGKVGEIDWQTARMAFYYDIAGVRASSQILSLLTITTPDHLLYGTDYPYAKPQAVLMRDADIVVKEEYLTEYMMFAREIAEASLRTEEGVLCLYPVQDPDHPTHIRILEIYRDQAAYEAHLQTPHFKKYKQGTLHMVSNLDIHNHLSSLQL